MDLETYVDQLSGLPWLMLLSNIIEADLNWGFSRALSDFRMLAAKIRNAYVSGPRIFARSTNLCLS